MAEDKRKFRASNGLDAAGEKVINVAMADTSVLTDGVNVEYLIQENTVQLYDPTRGYKKDFAVLYNNRQWTAKENVPSPAGVFNEVYWTPIRTDPKWYPHNSGPRQLKAGDYLTIDTNAGTDVEFTLPSDAQDGDNIVLKDIGGKPGLTEVIVRAGLQSISDRGDRVTSAKMTIPFSEWTFVYVNKLWNLYNGSEADLGRIVRPAARSHQIQAGETIIRQYDRQDPIIVKFPKHAAKGDIIHFVGIDTVSVPYFHLELQSFDANTSVIKPGTTSTVLQRSLSGYFVFNADTNTWMLYDTDTTDRLRTVGSDTDLFPNETVAVVGSNNTTVQEINLKLPQNVAPGDQITVALNHMRLGQTVNIIPSGTDKILTDKNLTQFPKRSSYPPAGNWVNTTKLTFNGATDYPPVITFAYIDMGPIKQWLVVSCVPALERVDSTSDATKTRIGVIALANHTEALVDHENSPNTDKAITPETLARRTSTETRRGISRIATQAEVNRTTADAAYQDDLIVTPKKLDAKQATETMRGLAEIATQAEANGATDDARIVTPKKLHERKASETLTGIAALVAAGGTEGANRTTAGTGAYDFNDHTKIVTPKILDNYMASEISQGAVTMATSAEVIGGVANPVGESLAVSPAALHTKTATETRIGFSEIATQAETDAGTDDFRFVTPKKLHGRNAKENLTGIARIATQAEFDSGTLDTVISTPLKIKTFFDRTIRVAVDGTAGLTQSGTLWGTLNVGILASTEAQRGTLKLATQALTDAGADDTTAVTPKKLHAKKSTQTTEGIIRTATDAEVVTGTSTILAVTPATLKNVVQTEVTWEAKPTRRGFVKTSEGAITFIGNDTVGNTQNLDLYVKNGYAISPYELNKTLANYMPLKAKAVDSDKLDGLDSTQFIRRDIDQTVEGALSLNNNLTANSSIWSKGVVDLGTKTVLDESSPVVYARAFVSNAANFAFVGERVGTTNKLSIGYKYLTGNTNAIDINSVDIISNGDVYLHKDANVGANANVGVSLTVGANTYSNKYYVAGSLLAQEVGGKNVIGSSERILRLGSTDAGNIEAADSGASYKVLTEKNFVAINDPKYVNRAGSSMTGRLTISAPIVSNIADGFYSPSNIPNANTFGTWTIEVTASAKYNLLPGYVVGVPEINEITGEPTGFIDHYDEFKGPGTLSQFGSSATSGAGTYQIWSPRPAGTTTGHYAQTLWVNHWNPVTNRWDGWGRMYTSNNPPTAKDIGAMSDNGSIFSSLRIRDWIQVGNLRIYADPTTKTVRFDWIE